MANSISSTSEDEGNSRTEAAAKTKTARRIRATGNFRTTNKNRTPDLPGSVHIFTRGHYMEPRDKIKNGRQTVQIFDCTPQYVVELIHKESRGEKVVSASAGQFIPSHGMMGPLAVVTLVTEKPFQSRIRR